MKFLNTDDVLTGSVRPHERDLAELVIDELRVEGVIATNPTYGYKWLCTCLACERELALYTPWIMRMQQRGKAACQSCLREVREGERIEKQGRAGVIRQRIAEIFQSTGSLYGCVEFAREVQQQLEDVLEAEGSGPGRIDMAYWEMQVSEGLESDEANYRGAHIQNIYNLFPVASLDHELSYKCDFCDSYHFEGFACVGCIEFVCRDCVKSDSKHRCEPREEKAGCHLDEIGAVYGLSRERIRTLVERDLYTTHKKMVTLLDETNDIGFATAADARDAYCPE